MVFVREPSPGSLVNFALSDSLTVFGPPTPADRSGASECAGCHVVDGPNVENGSPAALGKATFDESEKQAWVMFFALPPLNQSTLGTSACT